MRFQPKTEDDLKREQLCPPGIYPFTVLNAADKQSADKRRPDGSPKEMIALKLDVHADDGSSYHVYDYISGDFMEHKLRHFAVATNLLAKYEAGSLAASDCEGKTGWCNLDVQDNKQYGPKNTVKDYCAGKESAASAPAASPVGRADIAAAQVEEDDVPF